jgi:hypothetical protein
MQVEISEDGFINMMRNQNGGALIDELDRELIKANQAVLDHGGKATITLKISLARIKHLEAAMDIGHDVVVSLPKEERPHSAMFLTTGNGLSAQFQKQESLQLGETAAPVTRKLETVQPISRLGGDKS